MDDIEEIDLKEILGVFWSKKLLIIFLVILGAVFGFFYTKYFVVPKYKSSITLILSKPVNTSDDKDIDDSITQADITLNQKLISTYGELMTSRKVVSKVIDNLNLNIKYEELIKGISTSYVKDSDVVKVSVVTKDADISADVANELVKVFSVEVANIYNIQNVSVIDEGIPNYNPINVSVIKNVAIFGIAFFVLGAGIVFLIYYFDTTVKSKDEIEKILNVPVLAIIPNINDKKEGKRYGKGK